MLCLALAAKQLPISLKIPFVSVVITVELNRELPLIITSPTPVFKATDTEHIVFFCVYIGCLFMTRCLFVCLNVKRNISGLFFSCCKTEI